MKVLKISGKNLNSLKGEWSIDFTTNEYVAEGIFSITGATGAGKSTILDALSLALFGRTPRLKNVSKSTNEIMSRGTGDCYAEAEIETPEGKFRFTWTQARARNKFDGALQQPKHEIADIFSDEGNIIASQIKEVQVNVEKITGLDYDRFCRSVLLAQGEFAAFLKAKENERSEILEQITGTEIYSEISQRAHLKNKEETEKLKLLTARIEAVAILCEEDVKSLVENIGAKELELKSLKKDEETLSKAVGLFDSIDKNIEKIKEIEKSVLNKEADLKQCDILKNKTETALKAAKVAYESNKPVFDKVRLLDQSISEKVKLFEKEKKESVLKEETLKKKEKEHGIESAKVLEIDKLLKNNEEYISKNKADEVLTRELSGLKADLKSYSDLAVQIKEIGKTEKDLKKEIKEKSDAIMKAQKETDDLKNRKTLLEKEITDLSVKSKELLKGETVDHYRELKDGLHRELLLIKKVASLEEERDKLINGKECPLCGSKEHPYSKGGVPVADKTETKINEIDKIIRGFEDLDKNRIVLEKQVQASDKEFNKKETDLKLLVQEKKNLENKVTECGNDLKKFNEKLSGMFSDLKRKFEQFGITVDHDEAFKLHIETLEKRNEQWLSVLKEKEKITNEKGAVSIKLGELSAEIKALKESLSALASGLKTLEADLEGVKKERAAVFGTKLVEEEEKKLKTNVDKLDEEFKKVSEKFINATIELNKDKTGRDQLKKTNSENETELEKIKPLLPEGVTIGINSKNEISEKLLLIKNRDAELGQYLGGEKQKLKDNEENRKKTELIRREIDIQKKELQKWSALDGLIGSSDGARFRTFAQGLTFEIMVKHANVKLNEMTDRYILKRDMQNPLELNIIDRYKADEERSTKNLSGGESFLVSMALALGLSSLSSGKMRIDSLFLDEGFGTLDEETLETALNTLAGLHDQGKLIGVISHVQSMKERISTQISVIKLNGGNSRIEGPGVVFKSL